MFSHNDSKDSGWLYCNDECALVLFFLEAFERCHRKSTLLFHIW